MSPIEIAGCLFSLIGVYLTAKQRILAWPIGAVAVAIYVWIFFNSQLYADSFLNAVYFVMQLWGWWLWTRDNEHGKNVQPVLSVKPIPAAVALVGAGVSSVIIAYGLTKYTNQAYAYFDSAILTFSLIAQYAMAKKYLSCWTLWIVIDIVAAGVYLAKDLRLTSGLYLVFAVLAVIGHRDWRREQLATPA